MSRTRQPDGASRRPSARTAAAARRAADDHQIVDLIQNVRTVRITLEADLAAAAGAVEAGQVQVAREILEADRAEVTGLSATTLSTLAAPAPVTSPASGRRPRSRLLLALPAVPLVGALAMTAAAALSAGPAAHDQRAPVSRHAAQTAASLARLQALPITADSTLQRLEHVVTSHPAGSQVLTVANDLHKQLAAMIATSSNNPHQLGVVKHLLNLEQRVLEGDDSPGSTLALAASREISQLLHLAPTVRTEAIKPTSQPAPTTPAKAPTDVTSHRSTRPKRTQHASTSAPTSTSRHSSPKPKKSPNPLLGPGVFSNVL